MPLHTEPYLQALQRWPAGGRSILAHRQGNQLVVYQAYRTSIAEYAVAHQALGGPDFSYNRMSWIKPGFLWMMFRSGWATKENQERILALWLTVSDFETILRQAVPSTHDATVYPTHEAWKTALANSDVRLQWDPDHDPYGQKAERRAVQLGLRGDVLYAFGNQLLQKVEDITDFVHEQKKHVDRQNLDQLQIPVEEVILPEVTC